MKRVSLIVLAVVLAACSSGNNSTTTPNGTTTIQNWPANRVGVIRFYVYTEGRFSTQPLQVGEADVASNGSFVFNLSQIATEITSNNAALTEGARGLCFDMSKNLTLSQPTTRFAAVLPIAAVGVSGQTRGLLGYGLKPYTNFPLDVQSGDEITVLLYANQATQVTGSCSQSALNPFPAQQYNFNLNLSQGWNYVRGRVSATSPITVDLTSSTTAPNSALSYAPFPSMRNLALSIWRRISSLSHRQ